MHLTEPEDLLSSLIEGGWLVSSKSRNALPNRWRKRWLDSSDEECPENVKWLTESLVLPHVYWKKKKKHWSWDQIPDTEHESRLEPQPWRIWIQMQDRKRSLRWCSWIWWNRSPLKTHALSSIWFQSSLTRSRNDVMQRRDPRTRRIETTLDPEDSSITLLVAADQIRIYRAARAAHESSTWETL